MEAYTSMAQATKKSEWTMGTTPISERHSQPMIDGCVVYTGFGLYTGLFLAVYDGSDIFRGGRGVGSLVSWLIRFVYENSE